MNSKIIIILLAVLLAVSLGYNFYAKPATPSETPAAAAEQGEKQLWTCGMHPNVILDHPGVCPICGMKLVPLKPGGDKKSGEISIDPVTTQNIGVRTAMVMTSDLSRTIRTNGKVMVDESRTYTINPKVSGWIEKLYVDETGQSVRKGEPLFEFYSPDLLAAQEEYLLALASMKTSEQSGIESLQSSSRKMLEAARERLLNWDFSATQIAKLEESGKASRLTTYYSPADGIVMHKNAVEGNRVDAGSELIQLADLRRVWIEADIYEYELPWIDVGSLAEIKLPYDPAVQISSHINYIYPYLNPANRTAKIRLLVENSALSLKPDMFVDLQLETRSLTGVVALPREAVLRSGKHDVVFLAKSGGKFEPREVKLGLEADGGMYEIQSGVEAGDTVVISAQFLLDSERQLKDALEKLLAGGGSEEDLHKSMGHDHGSMSGMKPMSDAVKTEASGPTMEALFQSDTLYTCPDHKDIVTAEAGRYCPHDKKPLVQMAMNEISTLRASDPYGCVMCPVIHPGSEKDERCSICNMNLKPVPRES